MFHIIIDTLRFISRGVVLPILGVLILVSGVGKTASAGVVTVVDMKFDGSFTDGSGHLFSAVGNPKIDTNIKRN